jgi:hypothetical protein
MLLIIGFVYISTVLGSCAVGLNFCVHTYSFCVVYCGLMFVFISKVLAWHAVHLYLCLSPQCQHGVLLV